MGELKSVDLYIVLLIVTCTCVWVPYRSQQICFIKPRYHCDMLWYHRDIVYLVISKITTSRDGVALSQNHTIYRMSQDNLGKCSDGSPGETVHAKDCQGIEHGNFSQKRNLVSVSVIGKERNKRTKPLLTVKIDMPRGKRLSKRCEENKSHLKWNSRGRSWSYANPREHPKFHKKIKSEARCGIRRK